MVNAMGRKKKPQSDFAERLCAIRKKRGLTQIDLAALSGSSQRAISYYENEGGYPPALVVADLAKALEVTTDELLGVKPLSTVDKEEDTPEMRRLWKKFKLLVTLPEKDQKAVVRLINSLVSVRE